jgi:hypothetical protein
MLFLDISVDSLGGVERRNRCGTCGMVVRQVQGLPMQCNGNAYGFEACLVHSHFCIQVHVGSFTGSHLPVLCRILQTGVEPACKMWIFPDSAILIPSSETLLHPVP